MTTTHRIQSHIEANPSARTRDIAAIHQCSTALVSSVKRSLGMTDFHHEPIRLRLNAKNHRYVTREARRANITAQEFIQALVTDACWDEENR